MQRLEFSGAVRPLYWSLGVKWLMMLSLLRYVASVVGGWMDTEHWWMDTDNGKFKYPAEDFS